MSFRNVLIDNWRVLAPISGGIYLLAWIAWGSTIETPLHWVAFLLSPAIVVALFFLGYSPIFVLAWLGMRQDEQKRLRYADLDREIAVGARSKDLELAYRMACLAAEKAEADFRAWRQAQPGLLESWLYGNGCRTTPNLYPESRYTKCWRTACDRNYIAEGLKRCLREHTENTQGAAHE